MVDQLIAQLKNRPEGFTDGETVVVPDTDINIDEGDNRMFLFGGTVTLNDIVNAVNQVGAAPGDLMAILEALKSAGAPLPSPNAARSCSR